MDELGYHTILADTDFNKIAPFNTVPIVIDRFDEAKIRKVYYDLVEANVDFRDEHALDWICDHWRKYTRDNKCYNGKLIKEINWAIQQKLYIDIDTIDCHGQGIIFTPNVNDKFIIPGPTPADKVPVVIGPNNYLKLDIFFNLINIYNESKRQTILYQYDRYNDDCELVQTICDTKTFDQALLYAYDNDYYIDISQVDDTWKGFKLVKCPANKIMIKPTCVVADGHHHDLVARYIHSGLDDKVDLEWDYGAEAWPVPLVKVLDQAKHMGYIVDISKFDEIPTLSYHESVSGRIKLLKINAMALPDCFNNVKLFLDQLRGEMSDETMTIVLDHYQTESENYQQFSREIVLIFQISMKIIHQLF